MIGRSYDDMRKREEDSMTYDKDKKDMILVENLYPLPFITYLARFLINYDER